MTWAFEFVDPSGDRWTQLLDKTPHLVFHRAPWANVVRQGVSSRVVATIFTESGELRAGALGFVLGTFGVKIAYFNFPYGSIFGEPPPPAELSRLLKQIAKSIGVCQIQLVGYPGGPNLSGSGMIAQPDQTSILNVEGMSCDDLWRGYRRSRRQDIRKTRERGVTVEESTDRNDVDSVYQCYLETMQRTQGLARYKRSLLVAIVEEISYSSIGAMFVARADGAVIAGMLIVDSPQMSHGLLLASSNAARKHQPNKLLLHTAAERTIQHGKQGLDYMPSGQSADGVSQFKQLWGADSINISHQLLVTGPFRARLWQTAYRAAAVPPFRNFLSWLRSIRS